MSLANPFATGIPNGISCSCRQVWRSWQSSSEYVVAFSI